MIYKIANWWHLSFIGLSIILLIVGAMGIFFIEDASPDMHVYPARFILLAMISILISLPGWLITMIPRSRKIKG